MTCMFVHLVSCSIYYYLDNENCHDNNNSNETYLDNRFILIIAQHYFRAFLCITIVCGVKK